MIDLSPSRIIPNKAHPAATTIRAREQLTVAPSDRPIYHVTINNSDKNLSFHPGDSLAIFPQNDPQLVLQLLHQIECDESTLIFDPKSKRTHLALSYFTSHVNLSLVSSALVQYISLHAKQIEHRKRLSHLLLPENRPLLQQFCADNDLLDLLSYLPPAFPFSVELLSCFAPLLPRFYSISSSSAAHPDEIHLLVALASYQHKGQTRYGVASSFLCQIATIHSTPIHCYVQSAKSFRLPSQPHTDIIMIGPGTGVAPYRAFLQERVIHNDQGRNWLFFGGRHRHSDFLYQSFWEDLAEKGMLRLSTAFSRDQEEKQYVQHLLLSHSQDIFSWLEQGAFFYVCGDAKNMAKDVQQTLISLIQQEASVSEKAASDYCRKLRLDKRYLTDVY